MPNENAGTASSDTPAGQIPVSPDNPCPFLRALVAGGFVGGHVVPLATLGQAVEAASGEQGLNKKLVGMKTFPIALIANGLNPLRLLRSWWSGAVLDNLRNGPLDKHGVGSRILDATAHVNEAEIARLAEFGKDRQDPAGGTERGLTASEITTYMNANFARAKGKRRWCDRILMIGEWPVLLKIMGKGEGKARYLSVAEVRTLFVESAAAGADCCAPEGAAAVHAGNNPSQARQSSARGDRLCSRGDRRDYRIPRRGREHPAAVHRSIAAPSLADPRPHQRGALARPELVDGGKALVPPCKSGHRDVSGALRLVCRAGTTGHPLVHPTRPVQGQQLPRTVRFPAKPENHPYRRSDLAPLRLFESPTPRPSWRRRPSRA